MGFGNGSLAKSAERSFHERLYAGGLVMPLELGSKRWCIVMIRSLSCTAV